MNTQLQRSPALFSPPQPPHPHTAASTSTPARSPPAAARLTEANRKLEANVQDAVARDVQSEARIRDLEVELTNALSNTRAVHNFLVDALGNLESNNQKLDHALVDALPSVSHSLDLSSARLSTLATRLPHIRTQVAHIRHAYDSGAEKARALARELEWVAAKPHEKVLRTALAGMLREDVPVRRTDVWGIRLVILVLLILVGWLMGGALDGAYRAYRHRLVWGDKLIS